MFFPLTHGIIQQSSGNKVKQPGTGALILEGYAPTLTYYAPYETYIEWTVGISGATWTVTFDNNNGRTRTYNASFGSGTSSIQNLRYFDDTVKITVSKTNNGGITQDNALILTYKNAGTLLDTKTYASAGLDASSYILNLSGLSVGDVLYVVLSES